MLCMEKTLEYDIIRENPDCELLLTNSVSNLKEIKAMMAEQDVNKMMSKMRHSEANTRIKTSIGTSEWTDEEKTKSLTCITLFELCFKRQQCTGTKRGAYG